MYRVLYVIIICAIVFSLAGCSSDSKSVLAPTDSESVVPSTAPESVSSSTEPTPDKVNDTILSPDGMYKAVPEVQSQWYSPDKTLCGYAGDSSSPGKIKVVISKAGQGISSVANETVLPLSNSVLSIEDIKFIDEHTVGIVGHVNPSTNVYQVFDLQTGKVLHEYYGYGFTYSGDTLYYVQAPQHFSGVSGHNRILTSNGKMLYESAENVTISPDLEVKDGSIVFHEINSQTGEQTMKSHSTTNSINTNSDVNYYN